MRTAGWAEGSRRVASAGLLLTLAIGIGACGGPPSYEPSPKDWDDNSDQSDTAAEQRGTVGSGKGSSAGGGSGSGTQVELCTRLDVAAVQQTFEAPEEPTTESAEEIAGLQDLSVLGGCAYEWGGGEAAGSLTVTVAVADSSDDAATFLEDQASAVGLSGDPVDGLGDASLLDTSGSVVSDAAVAIGVSDLDGTTTLVILAGPLDADSSAYAEIGSSVMSTFG